MIFEFVIRPGKARLSRVVAIGCALWTGLATPTQAAESTKPDGQMDFDTVNTMAETFNRGMAAFEKREWATAIAEMEKVISICEGYPDKKAMESQKDRLAPVYYTVGAAAFNLPDYPKAIAAFERFVSEFPKSEKLPHARLAIARAAFMSKDFDKAVKLFGEMERYPSMREQSLVIQAQCFKETRQDGGNDRGGGEIARRRHHHDAPGRSRADAGAGTGEGG